MKKGLASLPTHQRITHILAKITLKQKKLDEDASHFLRLCKGAGSYMLEERILQSVCVHSPTPYKPMIAVTAERVRGMGRRSALDDVAAVTQQNAESSNNNVLSGV